VERDYAVVGTWEETNITLTVFEAYIPRFFKGVRNIFECRLHVMLPILVQSNLKKIRERFD